MRSICKAWIPSYFAAMRSERRVMTPRTVKCVSSAHAMLMLCLSLPLTSATIFLRRLLEKELKKDFSKAYAMHMKYIQINEDDDENPKRRWEFDSIWHKIKRMLNICRLHVHSKNIIYIFFINHVLYLLFFIFIILLMFCIIILLVVFKTMIVWDTWQLNSLLAYAQRMRASSLISSSFSHADISFARFFAIMFSSFIDVSISSVDAAHMHSYNCTFNFCSLA